MSAADLKQRMADVPGIETLSMAIEGGGIMLRWGTNYSASVDAAASDGEIETAVRGAIRNRPASIIPETLAVSPALAPSKGVSTMSTNPASAGANVSKLMEDHVRMMGDIHNAQLRILESSLARQRDTVANAVGKVAEKIDSQTDDFLSIMGQFANDLG